ncbi:uncharacterized protein LOC127707938 isoform X2 [Mytilus californianus]|uniref:uncharacterized protein LOC127707938 isoform X2 n=1 Tax=Mytilus californianus TaxID=6549 RepID=UPI002247316D|nr:uncharacterized protein LOC127707938 isoform X2 [Mytilus californianus]
MVLLNQYLSLLNATYLTFQFQCCDTYCTFPGETCDRSRTEFCVCKACFCHNDSTFMQEEAKECRAHCSIERFRKHALEDDEEAGDKEDNVTQTTEESQDCVLITTLGIASFCGNVIGLIIGILLGIRCLLRRSYKQAQEQAEIESFIGRKDSGINDESGDESGIGTTLEFNTRRILTNVTDDINRPSKVLISGQRHDLDDSSHTVEQEIPQETHVVKMANNVPTHAIQNP